MTRTPRSDRAVLALILLVALGLRLHQIGFGLPSMYDPDEPMFMLKAVELLSRSAPPATAGCVITCWPGCLPASPSLPNGPPPPPAR